MESFLNILWVALALAALYLWRMRWAGQPRANRHAPWRQWTAFICALILLFFTVSLTDDLHSELVVYEEATAGRRHTTDVAGPHHAPPPHSAGAPLAILRHPDFTPIFSCTGIVTVRNNFRVAPEVLVSLAGRAPPEFST